MTRGELHDLGGRELGFDGRPDAGVFAFGEEFAGCPFLGCPQEQDLVGADSLIGEEFRRMRGDDHLDLFVVRDLGQEGGQGAHDGGLQEGFGLLQQH